MKDHYENLSNKIANNKVKSIVITIKNKTKQKQKQTKTK
jgi:hypothetical protein